MRNFALLAALLLAGTLSVGAQNRSAELDQAYRELVAAQRALDEAKERREALKEPGPDDRIGTAGGKSRLLPQYFEEQRSAEQAVTSAEQRYERALERWQQLR